MLNLLMAKHNICNERYQDLLGTAKAWAEHGKNKEKLEHDKN